jgi:(1->4)-alpha-D-glucan 1-alpha-D-glucosylmutase
MMGALHFRRAHPELFKVGSDYLPLFADGNAHEHVISFARRRENQMVISVAPRFSSTLMKGEMRAPLGEEVWEDAIIALPPDSPTKFRNVLTGETVEASNDGLLCREIFASFPVALLSSV